MKGRVRPQKQVRFNGFCPRGGGARPFTQFSIKHLVLLKILSLGFTVQGGARAASGAGGGAGAAANREP